MKNALLLGTAAALLTAITPVNAQETTSPAPATSQPAPSTAPADPATTTPAPGAPAAESGSFSDADLKAFARAAIAANKIQQDTAVPATEKQPKMLAAVQAEGLDPVKFNAIAQASQSDPVLKQRVQAAAASEQQSAAPATPTP